MYILLSILEKMTASLREAYFTEDSDESPGGNEVYRSFELFDFVIVFFMHRQDARR